MDDSASLYCKIFLDTHADTSRQDVTTLVARIIGGSVARYTITAGPCEVDVRDNTDFNPARRSDPTDGFLYFRFYLDVEAMPGQTRAAQLNLVARLLTGLWAEGFVAVAASDYEEALPNRGFNSHALPDVIPPVDA